jgi:hypothetical protein
VGAKDGIRDLGFGGRGRSGGRSRCAGRNEYWLGGRVHLGNESKMAVHASREAGFAQVVVVNLQALVSGADERRLVAAVASDADVNKWVLLGCSALCLLLLLRKLGRGLGGYRRSLQGRLRNSGNGQIGFTLNLNGIVLGTDGRDAEAALTGANDSHGFIHKAELQADDQWVHVG